MKMQRTISALATIVVLFYIFPVQAGKQHKQENIENSKSLNHFLTSGYSRKKILETAATHNGNLLFKHWKNTPDTIHIIAFRIEFNGGQPDTTSYTTGNGLFGLRGGGDKTERKYYDHGVYKYDNLPHDSAYFDRQLQFVRDYFSTVSHGKLYIEYSIYPSGQEKAYTLESSMVEYGPGDKLAKETNAEYNTRVNIKLLKFIRDAVDQANSAAESPFSGLHYNPAGNIVDSADHRAVFLILHAGASYLTDGGYNGSSYRNSPFDMIDAFITPDYLEAYKDTLKLASSGIKVTGASGQSLLVDEIMMAPETSNQDSLNFGIHGILVNEIARQIGIPDLYSTSSGTTAIGGFCIMDFYGYSSGQGFVPPWPSAWVRSFMGWEEPVVASMGSNRSFRLKAACLGHGLATDTTILLIPLNDHEYYLVENRQRSLVGGSGIFTYDTTDNNIYIDPSFPLNIDNNVVTKSDTSSEILKVKNFDAAAPASGIVVWHVDENIIRDRLNYDYLNADSTYRAVSLVEADGVNDIGYEFENSYYQLFYDYGGAEDIFPHRTINRTTSSGSDSTFTINFMGPWSKPATTA
ncbi:MAG TPA: hypothetical protein DCO75_11885, partial [Fibrobacteres bacterium]|nr:hypothetical protein [Fibrobacterota bacterium]